MTDGITTSTHGEVPPPAEVRALILAAGHGTRLHPLTTSIPKCLVPISGRPLLEFWEDSLVAAGVSCARVNTHHLHSAVEHFAGERNRVGRLVWETAYEPVLLGSAGTVSANVEFAEGASTILIVYADNLSEIDLFDMLREHRASHQPVTMALFHASDPTSCGIASLDARNHVVGFEEKPDCPTSDLAFAGVLAITPEAWREISDMDAFDIGHEVLPRFVGRMHGYEVTGFHCDIGTHEALAAARRHVGLRRGGARS